MNKVKLDQVNLSLLIMIRNEFAKEDEWSTLGQRCKELGLSQDHCGVLAIMNEDTSMTWNEKLWAYLRYIFILGARCGAVALCRMSMSRKPAHEYEQHFVQDLNHPQHEKAEGIFIARRYEERNKRAFTSPISTDAIVKMREIQLMIKVPNEEVEKMFCKTIMLKFIYPGEAEPFHLKGFELMHHLSMKTKRMSLLSS